MELATKLKAAQAELAKRTSEMGELQSRMLDCE